MFRFIFFLSISFIVTPSFAQKFYFTGLDIKANLMSDYPPQKDKANIIVSAASDPHSKEKAEFITSKLYLPNEKENANCNFIMADLYFRPLKTNHFFRWSEWTIGFGYSPLAMNVQTYRPLYRWDDTALYGMSRTIGKRTGYMIESKCIINSSPYDSRLIKYFGLGIRAAAFSELYNSVIWSKSTSSKYTNYDTSHLSNTSNALLGIYTTGGIKYNLSCKFNVFTDINLGYCWRFYPEKVNTGGFNFSFSIGIKYKMGNGPPPAPDESKQAPEEDEKSNKRNRKKMEVYW